MLFIKIEIFFITVLNKILLCVKYEIKINFIADHVLQFLKSPLKPVFQIKKLALSANKALQPIA